MTKKTICFLTLAYHPAIGGAEKQAQFLAEKWARDGWKVIVVTRRVSGVPNRETLNGVSIERIPTLWIPGFSWITFCGAGLLALLPSLSDLACTVVFMVNPAALLGAILSRFFAVPMILRPSAGGATGNLSSVAGSGLGRAKLSFILGAASYGAAINGPIVDELAAAGFPRSAIRQIPNGVSLDHFRPASSAATKPVVLFVGRLEKVKNIDGLLQAWPEVVRERPDARLVIVGDGSQRPALEAMVAEKGIRASVTFEGSQKNVLPYFQAAQILILPSHREGLSNALLEAMACGVVPVATHVGGSRAILEKLSPDLLINPDTPQEWPRVLISLLKDDARRQALSLRARTIIEDRFSMSRVSRQYEDLLANLGRSVRRHPFPILAYHRVLPNPVYGIDIASREFEKQLAWLAAKGYRSISMNEFDRLWRAGSAWPNKTIVLTFDDGHREFFEHARPILDRYKFRAVLFVNTGLLGKKYWVVGRRPAPVIWHETAPAGFNPSSPDSRIYEFMSWDQVKQLERDGHDIQSHGVTHPFLTKLTDADLGRELVDSKKRLEETLGRPIDYFCYPSGDFDARVEREVQQAGYRGAVQTPSHDLLFSHWDDAYAWERIGAWQDVQFWKFKGLVEGWYPKAYRAAPRWVWALLRGAYRVASPAKTVSVSAEPKANNN